MDEYKILKNKEFGFKYVSPTPSSELLDDFYNKSYFDTNGYEVEYTSDELTHKLLPAHEIEYVVKKQNGTLLDVGCGEAFVVNYFHKKGWDVTGLDFSHDGVKRHFPDIVDRIIKGDVYKSLDKLIKSGEKYDVIVCNNVLEHVVDPIDFLKRFKSLCKKETIVRIQVPNDFSWLQKSLLVDDKIDNKYWIAPPGHLSYFDEKNLRNILDGHGYKILDMLGDFPIELYLINDVSNYNKIKEVGKSAHMARIYFDVKLFSESMDKYISFKRGCGKSGVCRNLIAYFSLKN